MRVGQCSKRSNEVESRRMALKNTRRPPEPPRSAAARRRFERIFLPQLNDAKSAKLVAKLFELARVATCR